MKKIVDLKYTLRGLVIACGIGYILASFTPLPFWVAFSVVVFSMVINGIIADYEDNLPGGFNKPMSQEEIQLEKARRRKRLFPYRLTFWIIFIVTMAFLVWRLSS